MNETLMVIAAHPDDEVLGCAATVKKRVNQGWDAILVIATRGVSGRNQTPSPEEKIQQQRLQQETKQAAKIIGFSHIHSLNFPDNRLDTVSRNDIALNLRTLVQEYKPTVVFTHHPGDYNWDHTRVHEAVLMACRANCPDHYPRQLLTFEVLSSTERAWQTPHTAFHPNIFIDISDAIAIKKEAMQAYQSELHSYPHPRSIEAIENLAKKRGNEVGLHYAEAFALVRQIERD